MTTTALVAKKTTKHKDDANETTTTETDKRASAERVMLAGEALLDEIDAVLDVEIATTEILTLGDLIRNGSKLHPQCVGNWKGAKGETCALSAAFDGAKALGLV